MIRLTPVGGGNVILDHLFDKAFPRPTYYVDIDVSMHTIEIVNLGRPAASAKRDLRLVGSGVWREL